MISKIEADEPTGAILWTRRKIVGCIYDQGFDKMSSVLLEQGLFYFFPAPREMITEEHTFP